MFSNGRLKPTADNLIRQEHHIVVQSYAKFQRFSSATKVLSMKLDQGHTS